MQRSILPTGVLLTVCSLMACSATPRSVKRPSASSAAPSSVTSRPHEVMVLRGCGGSFLPGGVHASREEREQAAIRARAQSRWGGGYRSLHPPAGFHAPVREEDQVELDDLVNAFVHEFDATTVTVRIFDHPAAPAHGRSLLRYVVQTFDTNGEDLDDSVDDDSLVLWFDRVAELRDDRGRRIVEWAYVEKGCEREELYERFIEDGEHLWHIRMTVNPWAPEAALLEWMALFFDAPLAGPAPLDRRGLDGKATTR